MEVLIRQESPADYMAVETVVKAAFRDLEISDQTEHLLLSRLRKSDAFIPDLSLLAETEGKIIGHVILTKVLINGTGTSSESLSLAPLSVLPEYQKKGIGAKLILAAHQRAKQMGYNSIMLLGYPEYYPRFGYEIASKFGIQFPFEAPDESCMLIELVENSLEGIHGVIEFSPAFFE